MKQAAKHAIAKGIKKATKKIITALKMKGITLSAKPAAKPAAAASNKTVVTPPPGNSTTNSQISDDATLDDATLDDAIAKTESR